MNPKKGKIKIVFVYLGNYCRSPMAEAIFNKLAQEDGLGDNFSISSAGTKDWDVGLRPDPRTQKLLFENHYPLSPQKRAQMISQVEIRTADYLIAMSHDVAEDLGNGLNTHLLLDFTPEIQDKDIADPYPTNTFPEAFKLIEYGIKAFYAYIKQKDFG